MDWFQNLKKKKCNKYAKKAFFQGCASDWKTIGELVASLEERINGMKCSLNVEPYFTMSDGDLRAEMHNGLCDKR